MQLITIQEQRQNKDIFRHMKTKRTPSTDVHARKSHSARREMNPQRRHGRSNGEHIDKMLVNLVTYQPKKFYDLKNVKENLKRQQEHREG